MKLSVHASTHPGFVLPVSDALLMSGHMAGICYMKDDFDAIVSEPEEKTLRRVEGTVKSGHHSTSGHASYTFIIEGMPKIVAMLLNNEHDYETSEKSARYTVMSALATIDEAEVDVDQASAEEKRIYEKWTKILEEVISRKYPEIKPATVNKLALENARYFISVFTPATTMAHTLSLRQANYIIGFCESMVAKPSNSPFINRLKPYLSDLAAQLKKFVNVDKLRDNKGREFSLFAKRDRGVSWGEVYSTNYYGTFSQLAQAQRHRTLWYEMKIPTPGTAEYYVPPILLDDDKLREEWLADMDSLRFNYPQGMLIQINERGTLEAFCLKCHERLCGAAQLEICMQTKKTLDHYMIDTLDRMDTDIYQEIGGFVGKTKCQFGYYTCDRPCPLGPKHAFDRLI